VSAPWITCGEEQPIFLFESQDAVTSRFAGLLNELCRSAERIRVDLSITHRVAEHDAKKGQLAIHS
jgi:hypothetical protein